MAKNGEKDDDKPIKTLSEGGRTCRWALRSGAGRWDPEGGAWRYAAPAVALPACRAACRAACVRRPRERRCCTAFAQRTSDS